jgi:hypothetical protein
MVTRVNPGTPPASASVPCSISLRSFLLLKELTSIQLQMACAQAFQTTGEERKEWVDAIVNQIITTPYDDRTLDYL